MPFFEDLVKNLPGRKMKANQKNKFPLGNAQAMASSTESLTTVVDLNNPDVGTASIVKSKSLNAILSGLQLRNQSDNKSKANRYNQTATPYDIIIRINSLTDLRAQGWEILLGQHIHNAFENHLFSPIDNQAEKETGVVVTVLGAYNRGKSFLLNKLCKITVPTGNLIHTEGISITAGKDNYTNIVFLDTAGTDTPVRKDEIDSKRATEALLREVVLHLCTFIIIVVNRLRATDQIYIQEILKYCQTAPNKAGVIIVHNFNDIENLDDLNEGIRTEIETIFEARLTERQPVLDGVAKKIQFYTSKQNGIDVRHFILAKEGSYAAHIWNLQSLDGMMNLFQNCTEFYRKFDIIESVIQYTNTKLPHLFTRSKTTTKDERSPEYLQIVQHSSQPFIVLRDRKDRENLHDDPCTLEIMENLVYDNAGYFLKHEIEEWQPRYNFYEIGDKLRLVLELPGFKQGECETKIREESITIQGTRADLNLSEDSTIRQSDIPSGSFKLNIPFPFHIDVPRTEIVRNEGFVILIATKKKAIEETLVI